MEEGRRRTDEYRWERKEGRKGKEKGKKAKGKRRARTNREVKGRIIMEEMRERA